MLNQCKWCTNKPLKDFQKCLHHAFDDSLDPILEKTKIEWILQVFWLSICTLITSSHLQDYKKKALVQTFKCVKNSIDAITSCEIPILQSRWCLPKNTLVTNTPFNTYTLNFVSHYVCMFLSLCLFCNMFWTLKLCKWLCLV